MSSLKFSSFLLLLAIATSNAQLMRTVEKSSASDENTKMSEHEGTMATLGGVQKVQICFGNEGQHLINPKVCDFDHLLTRKDKGFLKQSLKELETLTSGMTTSQLQEQGKGGLKITVLLLKNINDPKETDMKIFDILKHHANIHPSDRVGVLVMSVGSNFGQQQRENLQTDLLMNNPVYYYFPNGVWSNFYSMSTWNSLIQPSDIVQLYNNEASIFRQGNYGMALLSIIQGIRNKVSQGKITNTQQLFQQQFPQSKQISSVSQFNAVSSSGQFGGLNTMDVQKVGRCLEQFEGKVCDPDMLLQMAQKGQIDTVLRELESETVEFDNRQQIGKFSTCKKGGIKLATIIIKDVQNQPIVDKKIEDMLYQWSLTHPCDRTAVMMLSPSEKTTIQQQGIEQQPYFFRFPNSGVWSKFYGIANLNVPVSSHEIVQLYDQEKPLIRQGDYTQALMNIIRGFKQRAISRRVTRQVDFSSNVQEGSMKKGLLGEEKQQLLYIVDECVQDLRTKVCDPKQVLTSNEQDQLKNSLKQIERESEQFSETDASKKKGFVFTVVVLPYMDDVFEVEHKLNSGLEKWSMEHLNNPASIIMLSSNKGDIYGRSKFYATSTRDAPVRPHELVQYYNTNKLLIREGKHSEALLNIIEKIRERIQSRTGTL